MPSRVHQQDRIAAAFLDQPELTVIQPIPVYPLSQWVADRSARIDLLSGRPAARTAEPMLILRAWHTQIRIDRPGLSEAESFTLARAAREADRMLRNWPVHARSAEAHDGSGIFERWRAAVRKELQAGKRFTTEDWIAHLAEQLQGDTFPPGLLPDRIRLEGFVEFTRLEEQLFEAFEMAGVELIRTPMTGPGAGGNARKQCFDTLENELSAAASWAGQKLGAGCRRVGIVVNGLDQLHSRLIRVFEDAFMARELAGLEHSVQAPFSISSARPLSAEPLVRDAFMLLELSLAGGKRSHDFHRISRFLRSGCLAGAQLERFERGQLELLLRKKGIYYLSLNAVAEQAVRSPWSEGLKGLVSAINRLSKPGRPRPAAEQLLDWLDGWGWPGDAPYDVYCEAVVARLMRVFESLSHQDHRTPAECLTWLKRACEADCEQAPGGPLSPIQVMNVEEAQGRVFDAVRVLNMNLVNWPGRPFANPFLAPEQLKAIPRASENGMLAYAQAVTRSLASCAPEVVFSWCNRLDDIEVSSSPLIQQVPSSEIPDSVPGTLWKHLAPQAATIRDYRTHPWLKAAPAETGVALEHGHPKTLSHAAKFLAYQSACPLAAYLAFRLHAQMNDAPRPFESAAFKGELIHLALDFLYRPCKGTRAIPLVDHVGTAVDRALEASFARLRLLPAEELATRQSLVELLGDWLQFESMAELGKLEATEWRVSLELEGCSMEVRVDRINRLSDGRVFLLDYKTGADQKTASWAEERLGLPQLPLYAVLMADTDTHRPAGMALAYVRPNDMKLDGLSACGEVQGAGISGFETRPRKLARALGDWDNALLTWKRQLSGLLEEISRGECANRVFDEAALRYSDLQVLLRQEEGLLRSIERDSHAAR